MANIGRPTATIGVGSARGDTVLSGAIEDVEVEEGENVEEEELKGSLKTPGPTGRPFAAAVVVVAAALVLVLELLAGNVVLDVDAILDRLEEGNEPVPDALEGMAAPSAMEAARAAKDNSEIEPDRILKGSRVSTRDTRR